MSTAGTTFETSKEFEDNRGDTYPVGTKVSSVEPSESTDPSTKTYKVLVVGSTRLHHKIVWVDADTRKSLETQSLGYLARLNAQANAHG